MKQRPAVSHLTVPPLGWSASEARDPLGPRVWDELHRHWREFTASATRKPVGIGLRGNYPDVLPTLDAEGFQAEGLGQTVLG